MVVHEIAYGFGGPSEKKCQSSLIFYCKIPILCMCQVLLKICPNFAGHVSSLYFYILNLTQIKHTLTKVLVVLDR
jgi:hypothetical protein